MSTTGSSLLVEDVYDVLHLDHSSGGALTCGLLFYFLKFLHLHLCFELSWKVLFGAQILSIPCIVGNLTVTEVIF